MDIKNLQDIRQTPEYAGFMENIGWKVILFKQSNIQVFIKKLPFLPLSVIKALRYQSPIDHKKLKQLQKKHWVFLTKLEPFEIERANNDQIYFKLFKKTGFPLTPTKTIWINLAKKEVQLLKEMKSKTRYNLKKAQKNNLKVKIIPVNKITEQQLKDFYQLWSKNKPHDFVFKPSYYELKSLLDSFSDKCFFVFFKKGDAFLEVGNALLASCLILTSKNMAFYWHNCSTKEGKKYFAPTLCVWEAIKESKKRKLDIFDFEGVWDERYPKLNKGWKGFTRFKKGFLII